MYMALSQAGMQKLRGAKHPLVGLPAELTSVQSR